MCYEHVFILYESTTNGKVTIMHLTIADYPRNRFRIIECTLVVIFYPPFTSVNGECAFFFCK